MTSDDIPSHWRKFLAKAQEEDPKALLAGGCIRDTWCGKHHKDLDLFVTKQISYSGELDKDYMGNWKSRITESGLREYKECTKSIRGVTEGKWNGEDINIVTFTPWSSPAEMLEEFDFGICQIAYDGKEIITTPAFHWDYKHGVFTMMHGRRYEKSKGRFERINQRYGWKMAMSDKALVDAIKNITQKKTEVA